VTWISSYASDDKTHTFCVYDAPTPEAIRKTAARNQLPVDQGDTAAGRPAVHAELELGRARRPEHVDERAAWVPVGRTRRSARPERSCCSAPAHRPQAWRAADAGTVR
jgi:hypothetical protein